LLPSATGTSIDSQYVEAGSAAAGASTRTGEGAVGRGSGGGGAAAQATEKASGHATIARGPPAILGAGRPPGARVV
jgi:hypothetical protein